MFQTVPSSLCTKKTIYNFRGDNFDDDLAWQWMQLGDAFCSYAIVNVWNFNTTRTDLTADDAVADG